ncbi:hypothetical protein Pfo_012956 [Paulownia fortunei]|nr:hypothetical protein Pfo_012956 [Paulownia fortunei]
MRRDESTLQLEVFTGSHHPRLPPGFRFHPTDEELVVHYLKKKAASAPLPVAIIAEVDLYKYDPWELPSKASFGEQEWYFFSPRERKYPNGERPNRAATSGYWKATGTDKPILTGNGTQKIGVKKALVFYGGKPPKGIKTNWIMHEYRLLDDWVLCRIFKKINSSSRPMDHRERDDQSMEDMPVSMPTSSMDGYQSPIPGAAKPSGDHGNFFSGTISGNGSVIPSNPMSISPLASSSLLKSDFPQQLLSSQYWNGPPTNGTMFSSKQWEANEDNINPSDRNICFISLLNQQYPQTFHQNPLSEGPSDLGCIYMPNIRLASRFSNYKEISEWSMAKIMLRMGPFNLILHLNKVILDL